LSFGRGGWTGLDARTGDAVSTGLDGLDARTGDAASTGLDGLDSADRRRSYMLSGGSPPIPGADAIRAGRPGGHGELAAVMGRPGI
jgi:hypothetical protein